MMGQKQTVSLKGGLPSDEDAGAGYETGTGIFDPVLTELIIRWFCPPAGLVLDCFAGGSVRGIVASTLGRRYIGVDLSERQIQSNHDQATLICPDNLPEWYVGDSTRIDEILGNGRADLLFSCPPYGDLERYSDNPADISTMPYDRFMEAYRTIISKSLELLQNNRFACFVVGDFRDKDGHLRNFDGDTIRAFLDAGAYLYNHAVLLTAVGSLPIRAGRAFSSNRKLGKTHQDVLIFVKGSWREAVKACGELED
jgi:hypothetical protein